jgi:hypothetical protein
MTANRRVVSNCRSPILRPAAAGGWPLPRASVPSLTWPLAGAPVA